MGPTLLDFGAPYFFLGGGSGSRFHLREMDRIDRRELKFARRLGR